MKNSFIALMTVALVGGALAQVDPDVDMMGIYFDQHANDVCSDLPLYTPTDLYICITNASSSSGISGWEASVTINPAPAIPPTYSLLGTGALNVSAAPDFIVGLATPIPWSTSISVARITVTMLTADPIFFILDRAATGSFGNFPGYAAGDDPGHLQSCGFSVGAADICAVGNMGEEDCGVLPADDDTWGGVKALFR